MSTPFGLVVRFTLKPEGADGFDRLVAETLPAIRSSEPGTLAYVCHTVEGQPAQRIFYELYRSREAFDAHERQPHVRRFLAQRAQFLQEFSVDFLDVLDSKGIPEGNQ